MHSYQQSLISQANQSGQLSERLEKWLLSGMVSQDSFSHHILAKINAQLITELGQGGYFEFNQLLKRD